MTGDRLGGRGGGCHAQARTAGRRLTGLDGLRGLAILLVLVGHALDTDTAMAGVVIFFVLSGYLITGNLLGGPSLRRFYARRVRRLAPAALACLAATALVYGALGLTWNLGWGELLGACWAANLPDMTGHSGILFGPLHHFWSLSVEEQFYAVWPLTLLTLRRSLRAVSLLLIAAVGWHIWLGAHYGFHSPRFMFGTDATACLLLAGAWLALSGWRPHLDSRIWLGMLLTGCAAAMFWQPVIDLRLPIAGLTVIVIATAVQGRSWLDAAWLRWLGTVSYSAYLIHLPLMELWHETGWERAGMVGPALLLAAASRRWVELPALERRWPWTGVRRPRLALSAA